MSDINLKILWDSPLMNEILSHYCLIHFFLFLSLCLFLLVFSLHMCYIPCSCTVVLRYSVLLFQSLFSLLFWFWNLYLYIFKLRDSFLSHVQSTNKPIKAFFISVTVFLISSKNPSLSFLRFPSLCLHWLSVFTCCLLYPLELLAH